MRRRPGPFQAMYDLAIGEEVLISPNPGETVDKTLARLKIRVSKWGKDRAFRLRIDGPAIRAQRIEHAHKGKLSDWRMMPPGTRLLLKSNPTAADIKRARQTADMLDASTTTATDKGFWEVRLDGHGRLVVDCYINTTIAPPPDRIKLLGPNVPVRELWAGEWP